MPLLPEFRENAARSIVIAGEIDESLVNRIALDVCRLRCDGEEPITVYINSPGGSTLSAEHIRSLLKTPDQDGKICRIITVATCHADSAAAGLLALGDYALAYPNAVIHCHGFRLASHEITTQRAEHLAVSLKKSDDDFALRLARRTFERMSFHFANLRAVFDDIRDLFLKEKPGSLPKSDFECFAFAIAERLSEDFRELPTQAFWNQVRLSEMGDYVFSKNVEVKENEPLVKREAELLTLLLQYEIEEREKESALDSWSLLRGGIDEVVLDFKSFADYYWGPHTDDLEYHLQQLGLFFLTSEERDTYQQLIETDRENASKLLREKANPLVQPMWYFVVSLCRLLQSGEYSLTAQDAYWLGIVDEVIGEKLISLRLIAENPSA